MRRWSSLLLFLLSFSAGADTPRTREERIQLTVGGDSIPAVLRVPERDRDARLPAILVFGGFEEAGKVLELLQPKKRVILASFDYPYKGSRKFTFPGTLFEAGKLRQAMQDTQEGISQLILKLRERSDVDPRRMVVVGASFGAPFAIHAAAHHTEVSALVIVHGFGDIRGTIQHRLTQIWSGKLGVFSNFCAWLTASGIVAFLDPPVPEEDVRKLRSSQRALMIEATEDRFIPVGARKVLWDALSASPAQVKKIQMPGDHLQPGSDALIAKIMELTEKWLEEVGRL